MLTDMRKNLEDDTQGDPKAREVTLDMLRKAEISLKKVKIQVSHQKDLT
jgi:hypothetical protein